MPSALGVPVTVNGLSASVVSVLTVTALTADFLTSASDTFTVKFLPSASVVTYLPSPLIPNVSSLRFTTPADVLVSPANFKLMASVLALAALLIASATFLAVAKPSSPVTEAAPVVALLSIVARFVDTSTVSPFIFVEMKSPVAPFTLNATSPSFKDWLDVVPLSAPRETLRLTAAAASLILVLVSSLISNVTLPSLSTVAFVIVPSTKSKPLDNLTDLASVSAAVLARYVNVWLATVSFNCFTFTASVSSVPSATSLILLPPALISSRVNWTSLPAAFRKAMP